DRDRPLAMPGGQAVDRGDYPRLRVHERLAAGELEVARRLLDDAPRLRAAELGERAAGPRAGVHLQEGLVGAKREPPRRREGLDRLHAAFQRARVDRREADAIEPLDER